MEELKKLDPTLLQQVTAAPDDFIPSWGVKFVAPNGKHIDIPFKKETGSTTQAPGFISRRVAFDQFLVNNINRNFADFRQQHEMVATHQEADGIRVEIRSPETTYTIKTRLLICAEGARSGSARQLGNIQMEPEHYCAGVRAYYKGVKNLHPQGFIELHFLPEMLPGYFWIFPLPNGSANVGAGIRSDVAGKKKINLREAMLKAIKENPTIRDRFAAAEPEGKIMGWGLPLGSKKRVISGNHFLLLGDAASLIDPFTGEGIGNAMVCGRVAGETAVKALKQQDFSAAQLAAYDTAIYRQLWDELKLSSTMQKLVKYPWLFNFVVNKAEKNATLRETISCMFEDIDMRAKFRSPAFYFKLLFG